MTLIWGVNYVAAKIGLRYFPATLFAPMRILIAGVLVLPIFLWQLKRRPEWASAPRRDELPLLAVIGILGVGLNQLTFLLGMNRTSVGHAALVISLTPMLTLTLAWLRGQEALTLGKIAGMATAVGGIAVLNFGPTARASGATPLGDFLIFLAALFFAIFAVGGKEATSLHGGLTVTTFSHLASGICLLPMIVWASRGFDYAAVPLAGWATAIYMAAFPSVVCYLIFYYALNHIPASQVASFSYLQPWIAALSGFWVLGEPVTGTLLAGGLLILGGVFLAQRF